MRQRRQEVTVELRSRGDGRHAAAGAGIALGSGPLEQAEGVTITVADAPALLAIFALRGLEPCDALVDARADAFESSAAASWSPEGCPGALLVGALAAATARTRVSTHHHEAVVGTTIRDGIAYVAAAGGAGAFVLRRGVLHDVTPAATSAYRDRRWCQYTIHEHDRLILTCDSVRRAIQPGLLRRVVMASAALDAACERLLEATPGKGAAALVATFDGHLPHANAKDEFDCHVPASSEDER